MNLFQNCLLLDSKFASNIGSSKTPHLIVSCLDKTTKQNKLIVVNNPLVLTGIVFSDDLKFQNSFSENELKEMSHIGLYIPNSVVKLIKQYTLGKYTVISTDEFIKRLFINFFNWFLSNSNVLDNTGYYPIVIPVLNHKWPEVVATLSKAYDKLLKFETYTTDNKLKNIADSLLKALVITQLVLISLDSSKINLFKTKDSYKSLISKIVQKTFKWYKQDLFDRFIANTDRINKYWFRELFDYIANNYLITYYRNAITKFKFKIDFDVDTGKITIANHYLLSTPVENSLALYSIRQNLNDYSDIRIGYLDIEVYTDLGFPNEFEAKYPVISISLVIFDKAKQIWKVYSLVNIEPLLTNSNIKQVYKQTLDNIQQNFLQLKEYQNLFNRYPKEFSPDNFEGFVYYIADSERDLFKKLIEILKIEKVNLITGWNVVNFDFIYLYTRAKNFNWKFFENYFTNNHPIARAFLERLYNKAKKESEVIENDEQVINSETESSSTKRVYTAQMKVFVPYIPWIDYKQLFESSPLNTKSYPSYTLDYIVKTTLKVDEGKIKIGNITKAYKDNPELFLKYNILDSLLVYILDQKISFIDLIFEIRNFTGYFPMWNLNINKILTSYMLTVESGSWFIIDNEYAEKLATTFWELVYLNVNMYDKADIDEFRKYF